MNVKLEKFMAEVYASMPEYYFDLCDDDIGRQRFIDECAMMLSVQEQMKETRKEGYV